MAGAKLPKTDKQLGRMADAFAEALKSATKRRIKKTGIRANWKRAGKNWMAYNIRKKTYTTQISASGNLAQNIKVAKTDDYDYSVVMPFYSKFVIEGRNKGKGIPPKVMDKWIRQKRIKPRGGDGKFTSMSKESLGFMMNRKIKYFGIEGFDFVTPEREQILKRYKSALTRAMNQDIKDLIEKYTK
jgi:hypothetical protein